MGCSGGDSEGYQPRKRMSMGLAKTMMTVGTAVMIATGAYMYYDVSQTLKEKESPKYTELRQVYRNMESIESRFSRLSSLENIAITEYKGDLDEYSSLKQRYNQLKTQGVVDNYYNLRARAVARFLILFALSLASLGTVALGSTFYDAAKHRERITLHERASVAAVRP